jgi:hypothetical protein
LSYTPAGTKELIIVPTRTGQHTETTHTLADFTTRYAADEAVVNACYRQMCAITTRRHAPAEARQAGTRLEAALRAATATATEALPLAAQAEPRQGRLRRHHRRSRDAPPAAGRVWSAELVRLSRIGVWLRRETLDDLGVHVPTVVRVSSLAAIGPHIAGMGAAPAVPRPAVAETARIGVDLAAEIDGVQPRSQHTTEG